MKKKKLFYHLISILGYTFALAVNMHAVNGTFKDVIVFTLGPVVIILMILYPRMDKESTTDAAKGERIIDITYMCSMLLLILLAASYYS